MERVRSAAQRVRESLFLIPSAVVAALAVVARVAVYLDDRADAVSDLPFVLTVSVSGGRAIAVAVAGATITVAAIVVSITALSSQIAATQYSPRSVAGFFEDQFQQLVIGFVVGTFAYSIVVLAGLGDGAEQDVFESPSVTLAAVLGIVAVLAILAYLDHSLRRMRVGAVVRRIAEATVEAVRRHAGDGDDHEELEERVRPEHESTRARATSNGWVRAVDAAALSRRIPADTLVRIEVRVGEAVSERDLIATIWASSEEDRDLAGRAVRRFVHVGRERSLAGDPAFGIRQLVDIGLRALSPGVNDPTTATDVIQHLKQPIREILANDAPRRVFAGPDGRRVFLTEALSRSDYVHAAFSEIRLAAANQPAVLGTLIETVADLVDELKDADQESRATALLQEADLAAELARSSDFPPPDLERVLAAGERLRPSSPDAS